MGRGDRRAPPNAPPLMLESRARPTTIFFVGDSLTTVFADRMYGEPGEPHAFLARTGYVNGITAAGLTDAGGVLHPGIVTALLSAYVIVDDGGTLRALHRSESRQWRYAAVTMGRARVSPIVVLMVGSLDIVQTIAEFGTGADFTSDAVAAHVDRRIERFEDGLRALRALGIDALYAHSIVPINPDEEAFTKVFGVPCPAQARYDVAVLLADRMRAACERAGVAYLDLWPETTEGRWLRRDLILDGAHFNDRGALITMRHLVAAARPPFSAAS